MYYAYMVGVSMRQAAEDGATPAHFAAASGQVFTSMSHSHTLIVTFQHS